MKKFAVLLALLLVFGVTAAGAQEVPNSDESYSFILAKLAAEEGRYDEALAKLDAIALKHPDDLVLLYERAMIRIDAGQRDAAEIDLRRAVTANPNFYDAQRVLGRVVLDRAGNDRAKIDDALAHLQAAHRLNPDDLNSGMAVAQIYIATKRPEEAAKTLAALLERAPDQRAINYNYAQVLTTLGRKDEARQYLEKAVLLDATFGPAILQLVDIYQKEGAWRKAAEMLAPLVKDDPANVDLQRQYAYFLLRSGESEKARAAFKKLADLDPHDTRAQYYLAESLNDLEQFEEADKIYSRLLATSPDDADLLASLGLSQIGQRKYEEARKSFERILALKDATEPLQVLAKTQLAYVELQTGHLAEAVERAKPIFIYRDRPNAQAINIAVDALRKEKKYADAVSLLQPVAARFSDDPFVTSRYLEMMMRAGDREKAQQLATEQAKMGPKYTVAIAEAYVQNEDYPAAIALLKTAQATNAGDTDLQFALATAYERSGDRATAEKTFLDILNKNPEHGATLNYLGYMWAESGTNLERAAEMLKKAVSQEPRNGAYIDSLGWVYFRQGKLDLAEKYLTDATKLLPRDATVREHLGDVFAKRGDFHRALDLYRNALALEPEPKDEAKLRSKIADVEKQSQR
jgi:tetratricopeptide (TPR) repeat protein